MIYLLNPIHATVLAEHRHILVPRLVVILNQSKKDLTTPNPSQVAPSFIDAQETFNQAMCQAQAVGMDARIAAHEDFDLGGNSNPYQKKSTPWRLYEAKYQSLVTNSLEGVLSGTNQT